MLSSKPGQADLQVLQELLETGTVVPVIGRTSHWVFPEAIRQMTEGRGGGGKIAIIVRGADRGRFLERGRGRPRVS